jgi:hypothetical protein
MKRMKQTPPGPGGTTTDRFWHNQFAEGDNPHGMRAVTPNGLATDRSAGENHQWRMGDDIDGPRWTMPDREWPLGVGLPVGKAAKPGNGRSANRNRSGE